MNSPLSYFDTQLLFQAEGKADGAGRSGQEEVSDTADAIVASLACALEAKDFRLRRHSDRVAGYALQVGAMMNLGETETAILRHGSILHDIGNIGIADSILLKPGGLSDWEFEEVRMHPIIGETICKPLAALAPVLPLIRSHHEKLDGSGYPDALRGDTIPLLVRIVSVADVYDTLRCDRAYRGAFGHDDAVDILRKEVERGWWQSDIVEMLADITAPQGDFAPV
ncbi:MAG TPA: HD domain-containing phosphohydrolase [Abditibacteriaceae bacterium]|jgi:HD-GYP domain-containing protein (c-di-GMP phosphodiesterase class II)